MRFHRPHFPRKQIWRTPLCWLTVVAFFFLLCLTSLWNDQEANESRKNKISDENTVKAVRYNERNHKELPQVKLPLSHAQVNLLNQEMLKTTPDDILLWAFHTFPQLAQFTSFGASGIVILHKIEQLSFKHNSYFTVTIDTLHLFPETYQLIKQIKLRFPTMVLKTYQPKGIFSRKEFDKKYGIDLWLTDPDKYAYYSKIEPTQRALNDLNIMGWINGRRRSQGGARNRLLPLEIDSDGRIKINPLWSWSFDDVMKYIKLHQLPYNALMDKGYKSIGDTMTTRPVKQNAGERSGRFAQLNNKTECGMHSHLDFIARTKATPANKKKLECKFCVPVETNTFIEKVMKSNMDVLVELYSPMCGHCIRFAPEYNKISAYLKKFAGEKIMCVRLDIIHNRDFQTILSEYTGLTLNGVPKIFLRRNEDDKILLYTGTKKYQPLKEWLAIQLPYLT